MALNGLNVKEKAKLPNLRLDAADRLRSKSNSSKEFTGFCKILANATQEFQSAYDARDGAKILALEKKCTVYEVTKFYPGAERTGIVDSLVNIQKMFDNGKNPENVKERFDEIMKLTKSKKYLPTDKDFNRNVKSHHAMLQNCIGLRSSQEEREFYEIRMKCMNLLKELNKENIRYAYTGERTLTKKNKEMEHSR